MERYGPETYGERGADLYDAWYQDVLDPGASVDLLVELADGGPVLELGVGTGRIALPLAGRGLEVHGIDASPAMLEHLRAKPGGDRVHTHLGDMGEVAVDAEFRLVFVAANTLFMLASQDEQVRCFQVVARRLTPGGRFVVEAQIPDPALYGRPQDVRAQRVDTDSVVLAARRFDPVTQRLVAQQIQLSEAGARLVPGVLRYAWPAELDLMARLVEARALHRHQRPARVRLPAPHPPGALTRGRRGSAGAQPAPPRPYREAGGSFPPSRGPARRRCGGTADQLGRGLKRAEQASDTVRKAKHRPSQGGKVGVDDFADEQGGVEGLKDKADRLKDIAGGEGDMGDKGRDAMDEFRGQDDEDDEDDELDR
jgi:SAM-dependent methyltransferase